MIAQPTKVKLGKRPTLSQETITFPIMSKAQHDALDEDFATVCYEEGLPFSLFESPAMKRALRRLNPSYKPPTRQKIAGPLLDKAYSKMKDKVDEYLDSLSELNVITDESSDINKTRIANISIHIPIDSIHWLSEDLGSMQSSSVNITDWLEGHLHTLTHGNLERINSCATDTCPTMLLNVGAFVLETRSSTSLPHPMRFTWNSTPHRRSLTSHSAVQESP